MSFELPSQADASEQPLAVEGVWPEAYEVCRDDARRKLILQTRFYEVEHDLQQGGAISSVRFFRGSGENLLTASMSSEVVSATGQEAWSDRYEATPECRVVESGVEVSVTMEGKLCAEPVAAGGEAPQSRAEGGIRYRTTYLYRWGYIRVRKQFLFPDEGFPISRLLVHEWDLRPDLGHYGVRPGTQVQAGFKECQWGRLRPGAAFDCPYHSYFVPCYVVCGNPGREGLEWFMSSDLAQWTYDVCGEPGHGEVWIGPQAQPPAVVLRVSALLLPRRDRLRREFSLKGTLTFDFVLGLPLLSGQAHRPFLHACFERKHWPSEETVRGWAARGIRTAHFHHDGDSFRDGLFWRDGAYPPFEPAEMREFDRVIEACHRHGIRVATYFSNKELHPVTEAFQKNGREWARLPDGETILHNYYSGDEYGGQMCLRSGWLDFLKRYIDTVLSHHALDGVYYDWNVAMYCHNAAHSSRSALPDRGRETSFPSAQKDSPLGHWDMDELIELMEWTRRRVGANGLVIIHNTMTPCAVTENFADYVVAMEWGYGKLSVAAPALDDLPLEWNFLGSRSRGVIGYGCLTPDAPRALRRQMTLRCLLTGVAPWPASDIDLEMFAPLSCQDLSGFRFLDWRRDVVAVDATSVAAAAYDRRDRALIVLGNLTGQPATVKLNLRRGLFSLLPAARYRVTDLAKGQAVNLEAERLFKSGWRVSIAADSASILCVEPCTA